jgi:hypothetical protein
LIFQNQKRRQSILDNAIILQYLERMGYHTPAAAYTAHLREYLAWYRGYVSDFHITPCAWAPGGGR